WRGQRLGSIGHLGCYSFHETKNFISGEGGALLINDERFCERAEIIREKGTNRSQFFRGMVDKYTWVDLGSSYLPSEIIAAFLYAQLEQSETITARRLAIWRHYHELLEPLEAQGLLRRPVSNADSAGHNAHMYYILLPDLQTRSRLIQALKEQNIHAVFHYIPLHSSPMGKQLCQKDYQLPVTDQVSEQLLRLPCYYELSFKEIEKIILTIQSCLERK
ncbi:MAG: DegT/DnrJ/EryC1/StrS family aminotransferase, partial [Pseudomonas sp.]|nr:DegT/DnrJ/EryC1/StrS family aminotransferase [Pseudomonas sp.]